MSNTLQHTIGAEIRYQLAQTALALRTAEGSWDRMNLEEQYETLCRFLDHPHAHLPEPEIRERLL